MSAAAGANETEPRAVNGNTTDDTERDSAMQPVDTNLNINMETNLTERMFQDDMEWTVLNHVEDMCEENKITT